MTNLLHVYTNATAGGTDGTKLSEGDGTVPLTVGPLNATNNEESAPVKLALRCDAGYLTTGNTVITPSGTNSAMWALAPDNAGAAGTFGAYGAALTITSVINTTNTQIWVKAKSVSTESPSNDTSVKLNITATIAAQ